MVPPPRSAVAFWQGRKSIVAAPGCRHPAPRVTARPEGRMAVGVSSGREPREVPRYGPCSSPGRVGDPKRGVMKLPWRVLCGVIGLGAMLAATARETSPPCGAGCGAQTAACLKTARVTRSSCRMDCRANSAPADVGSCSRGCTDTFRSDRTTCRSNQPSCVQACDPSSASAGDPSTAACLGACGEDLGACARNATANLRTCVTGCRTASDVRSCLEGCAAPAQADTAACAADFQSCAGTCATTMPAHPSCGAPTGAACGGPCSTPGQVCRGVGRACSCTTP